MQTELKSATNFGFAVPERMQVSAFNICTRFEQLPKAALIRLTLSGVVFDGSNVFDGSKPTRLIYMQEMYSLEDTEFATVDTVDSDLASVRVNDILKALPDVHPQHGVIGLNADTLVFEYDAEFTVTEDGEPRTRTHTEYAAPLEITFARWLPEDRGEDTGPVVFSAVGIVNVPLNMWTLTVEQAVAVGEDPNAMMAMVASAIGNLLGKQHRPPTMLPLPSAIVGKFSLSEKLFDGGYDELLRVPTGTMLGRASVGMVRVLPPVPQIAPMIAELLFEVISGLDAWRDTGASLFGTYIDMNRLTKYMPEVTEETYVHHCALFVRMVKDKGESASVEEIEDAFILRRKTAFMLRSLPRMLNRVIDEMCLEHPRTPAEDDDDAKVHGPGKVIHAEAVAEDEKGNPPPDEEGWTEFEPLGRKRSTPEESTGDDDIDDFLRNLLG